jgi:D-beta-D-heptose 7-phosphate kinase/D-beta-D-heptose 1-phosphate adenosyltransferase
MTPPADLLSRLRSPHLLVLGDPILDRYTWGDAARVSPEAPVLVLEADRDESRLGGAASVANLLHALDARVSLAGVISTDAAGRTLTQLLDDAGIDRRCLLEDPTRRTTVKERFIGRAAHRHPQQILRVDREQRHDLSPALERQLAEAVATRLAEADALLIADYAKGVCTPGLLRTVIAAAGRRGVPVLVDPGRGRDFTHYQGATLLAPNRLELELAAGNPIRTPGDALDAAGRMCRDCQVEAVLVKLDSDGMVLVRAGQPGRHFPTRRRAVYDVTGAGDLVLAVAGLCRASGVPWEEAVPLANVAAGLEVEKWGVAPVTRAEILAELVRVDAGDRPPGTSEGERVVFP